jgi:nucleolar protein 14
MSDKKRESLKLKHKYKREMKGAIREIRRDRSFIANIKLKETMRR